MAENAVKESDRIHYYHADANAVGGTITRPFKDFVPSESSISLPLVGGFLHKEHQGQGIKWKNIVAYSNALTTVSGQKSETTAGPWLTEVTASIVDLNIRDVITASRVVAQLSIEHPHEKTEGSETDTPKIYLTGSQFIDLRISGIPVTPVLDYDLFEEYDKGPNGFPSLPWSQQQSLKTRAKKQYTEAGGAAKLPSWLKHHFHWLNSGETSNTNHGYVCSIVDHFEGIPSNFPGEVFGHGIYVRDFGRIFFGEVIITGGTISLSMIRAELGSPVGGSISAATARTNGHTYP